jgi:hypothetical protein
MRKTDAVREIVETLLRRTRKLLREGAVEVERFQRRAVRTVVVARRREAVESTEPVAVLSAAVGIANLVADGIVRRSRRREGRVLAATSQAGEVVHHRR